MTLAAARFFAADWESSSFIEFFVDLQLRVSDDARAGVGRTLARLSDHARFALQITLVRSVDSFLSYLGETEAVVLANLQGARWNDLSNRLTPEVEGVPVDAGERYLPALAHGNVRQLGRLFNATTGVELFLDSDDVAMFTRLVSIRNLIAHGRTFASDELASLVDETVSVGGLGLRWKEVRSDLDSMRYSVSRIDKETSELWHIHRPVTRNRLFEAIAAAAKVGDEGAGGDSHIEESWLKD